MKVSPLVLLLFATLGCGSGTPDVAEVKKHMTPAQLALGDPVVDSIGMLLVPIPAGEFQMGSADSDKFAPLKVEKPQHLVKISKRYYLSAFEVTQQQFEKVMGTEPWQADEYTPAEPNSPATYVSHNDAVEFCRKMTKQEGVEYRLPTEAEWEYACRAGTTTAFSFGDDASKMGQYAWFIKNTLDAGEYYAHRVGQKLPNPWGLFDMHGNVFEWCQDWPASYDRKKILIDPTGLVRGEYRAIRGGAFGQILLTARSASRYNEYPAHRGKNIGFRVARAYP